MKGVGEDTACTRERSLDVGPRQTPHLPVPWSWTSSLQSVREKVLWFLRSPVFGVLLLQPERTDTHCFFFITFQTFKTHNHFFLHLNLDDGTASAKETCNLPLAKPNEGFPGFILVDRLLSSLVILPHPPGPGPPPPPLRGFSPRSPTLELHRLLSPTSLCSPAAFPP